jgi:ribonuclease E
MANKMLIDATHPEETRVVVVRGSRVEEFDFESATRKQLRGNIYLAKVTRVEPSLQAAFVDYGGNRHGFLAFSEIHPDYYQIPTADRQALMEEEARIQAEIEREDAQRRKNRRSKPAAAAEASDNEDGESQVSENVEDAPEDEEDQVEVTGSEDALEELPERRIQQRMRRQYKIQEVIKRRQVLLVQVVKEERGNKGAALTTYLSLAGRYSVLMPNTARGGGISRKITNVADRKRLKTIAQELEVPEGMGVIVRTAGAARTKTEVKRDFEYLLRLWENVRELTLASSAPTLVYEEGSLIKRSIRDLYNKDIDEVLVSGDDGYREAKDFMRMLMPSHAKNVHPYKEPTPIFTRFAIESQLDAMFSPQVTLRSGGYIVINQTEALVSIDVNSGRSTREHNIEDTALQTNLEASEEVSRQLRLRDLAGLIVIDFIDMEEKRNNRSVERKLKDCLKNDRARIQVGRISHFGLMEMSRQRLRTGVLESSMVVCPHCAGTGMVRSVESQALHVIRSLEESLLKGATHNLIVRTRTAVALYILNQKRANLVDLEARFGLSITLVADDHAGSGGHLFQVERGEPLATPTPPQPLARITPESAAMDDEQPDVDYPDEAEEDEEEVEAEAEAPRGREGGREGGRRDERREGGRRDGGRDRGERGERGERAEGRPEREARAEGDEAGDERGGRRRRRRRRRGRGNREGVPGQAGEPTFESVADGDEEGVETEASVNEDAAEAGEIEGNEAETGAERGGDRDGDRGGRRRRRGRRGGRRRAEGEFGEAQGAEGGEDAGSDEAEAGEAEGRVAEPTAPAPVVEAVTEPVAAVEPAVEAAPEAAEDAAPKKKPRAPRKKKTDEAAAEAAPAAPVAEEAAPAPAKPKRSRAKAKPAEAAPAEMVEAPVAAPVAEVPVPAVEPVVTAPVAEAEAEAPAPAPEPEVASTELPPDRPRRSGWWAKKS